MTFICDECGLEKLDEEKHVVIDGISVKQVCSRCKDVDFVELSPLNQDEVDRRILETYRARKMEKPSISLERIKLRSHSPENEFKRRMRMERIELGLTTEQLAEIIGVSVRDLENFEKGIKEDIYIRKKLIDFFDGGGKERWLEQKKNAKSIEEEFELGGELEEFGEESGEEEKRGQDEKSGLE
jgi:ribosome-binding protein aMBF1 (putative translation factor)